MRISVKSLTLLFVGFSCVPAVAACTLGLGGQIKHVQLKEDSGIAALLHLGYEYGVCLGIENPGLGLIKGAREIDLTNATVSEVIQRILGSESYQVEERLGVVLIRNPGAGRSGSQLDTVLPEFTIPRMSVAWANEAIRVRLAGLEDPSKGIIGHVSDRLPDDKTGPFAEDGRTVRDILTSIVGGSNGAAWVSRRCSGKYHHAERACWSILEYDGDRPSFDSILGGVARRAIQEETGQKPEIP